MEGSDEAYEAERHDEHHGGREAEAGRLVGVESQHVAPAATGEAPGAAGGGGAAAAHAGGRSGRAAGPTVAGRAARRRRRRRTGTGRRSEPWRFGWKTGRRDDE